MGKFLGRHKVNLISILIVTIIFSCFFVFFYTLSFHKETTKPKAYIPQSKQVIKINPDQGKIEAFDIKLTSRPQFEVNLSGTKYSSFWSLSQEKRQGSVEAYIENTKADIKIDLDKKMNLQSKLLLLSPPSQNSIQPGMYSLHVKVRSVNDEDIIISQDFTWGVLAVNTNKAVYKQGEQVELGMVVLGDLGDTKCIAGEKLQFNTAHIWLTIESPSGKITKQSTTDGSIKGSNECADRSVTNKPDFYSGIKAQELGTYTLTMEAESVFGKRSIHSSFTVEENPAFNIERFFPTRIYPAVDYPVESVIIPGNDYKGIVSDYVPESFSISNIGNFGRVIEGNEYKTVQWEVDWRKGKKYTLRYTIHFPRVSPEFYIVGPLRIGNYSEGKAWKIASDSIFQFVQEAHNTTSGRSVSAVLPNPITRNNLVIKICYRTTNSSFSSQSGWTSAYNNSSGPRIYMYYRVAPTGLSTTVTCSTSSSGVIAVQALEFSGNSTSSVRDRRNRLNASTTCNNGAHQNTNPNLTPSNPDVLVISAFSATSTRTVTAHSAYTDSASSFNGSSGTFDSSWSEVVNNPPVSTADAVTYNAGGGTCDNLIVSFNPQISVSQGGYRFFENIDGPNPSDPYVAANTPATLNAPSKAFRLRMLLDVDSPSGTTLAVDSGDWMLEYAELPVSGDCVDGVYSPVDTIANGTPIAYNPNPSSGGNNAFISSSGNDPSDSGYITILEDYIETWLSDNSEDITNHQNTLANNNAGLFDFSLIDNTDDSYPRTFCLAIFNGDGSALDAYRSYPKVTTIIKDVVIRGGTDIVGGATLR
ncbi:MAG: hypothetical protein ACM3IJ_03100 [Candidatus Levyibacteriota bacterium]